MAQPQTKTGLTMNDVADYRMSRLTFNDFEISIEMTLEMKDGTTIVGTDVYPYGDVSAEFVLEMFQ